MQAHPLLEYARNITSQFGEDGILAEIFRRIAPRSRICVEFGAWDGRYLSNTWHWWRQEGWRAVLIEGDAQRYRALQRAVRRHPQATALHAFVTPKGDGCLDSLLEKAGVGSDIDLLSVDIDGDEYYVLEGLKRVRPRVIVAEYNPTIPPELSLVQAPGGYFGAAASALVELAARKSYRFVCCTQSNCIFVDQADFAALDSPEFDLVRDFPRQGLTYVVNSYDGATFASRVPLYSPSFRPLEPGTLASELASALRGKREGGTGAPPAGGLTAVRIFALPGASAGGSVWRRAAGWAWQRIASAPGFRSIREGLRRRAQSRKDRESLQRWAASGRPAPPPHLYKRQVVGELARRHGTRVLVETGTYEGEMVEAMRTQFDRVFSIELSPAHYKRAAERFAAAGNVEIVFGDSALMLADVLMEIEEPALFWLDGHYSAGSTARGDKETPILSELDAICRHPVQGHVILVDDARCFDGTADYPALAALETYVRERRPAASFEVRDDIVRIT